MQKQTQQLNSPFREKIFDLMKQQETSKILKLSSRMFQNKTAHTSHSPFREFSIDTELIDESKIIRLDTSGGVEHFKSLQQKFGLNKPQKSKSNERNSNTVSSERSDPKISSRQKKVSFIQNLGKTFYQPARSPTKNNNKSKKDHSLQKNNSSRNLKKYSGSKEKQIRKQSANHSFQNSSKNLKIYETHNQNSYKNHFSSANLYESNDKQTQKKNYLLQTLKKMQSVRKNLSKTFQQFDKDNHATSRSNKNQKKSKEKSKSNLTVIDYVSEKNESEIKYGLKGRQKKSQSKQREKKQENRSSSKNIFQKKTPNKKGRIINDSIEGGYSFSHSKQNQVIEKQLLKQLRSSCRNPEKWQTILRNELISVHFRVVKRKLIEIEIHAQSQLQTLDLELVKGYFICQSLKQHYVGVRKKEIITLLCSVRGVDLKFGEVNLLEMPKLCINIESKLDSGPLNFKKQLILPYSWLMLVQRQHKSNLNQSSSKKATREQLSKRIKTRSTLQRIQLKKGDKIPNIVEMLSFCSVEDKSISAKKQRGKIQSFRNKETYNNCPQVGKEKDCFVFSFELQEHQFKLFVKLNKEDNMRKNCHFTKTYNLQLEGKGQSLMGKIIAYLEILR